MGQRAPSGSEPEPAIQPVTLSGAFRRHESAERSAIHEAPHSCDVRYVTFSDQHPVVISRPLPAPRVEQHGTLADEVLLQVKVVDL